MDDIVDVPAAGVAGVAPVEQRVVRAEGDTGPTAGGGVLAEHVAARSGAQHGALGVGSVPPAQPVVVLGDHHAVRHARLDRQRRPGVGIEVVEGEERHEVVVVLDVRPSIAMVGDRLDHRRRVQQRVGDVAVEVGAVPLGVLPDRRPRRHGRRRYLHQEPESSMVPPLLVGRSWHPHLGRSSRWWVTTAESWHTRLP